MSFFAHIDWTWPAIALAFSLGVSLTRLFYSKGDTKKNGNVNKEYFKGLNFLLNEEPDKAIEVFIKALEVDSETVELHLALGGLFRRKGQVDRATRIHQNLIARPSLTDEQRLQAIFELAQDYYKAGLLDRAENLFLELRESGGFRRQAIDGLCNIYMQEKEWRAAIEVLRTHKRVDRPLYSNQLAHFWCELADLAIDKGQFDEARKCLRNALSEDKSTGRAVLLRGELSFKQGEYRKAISLWQSMLVNNESLAELVVEKMVRSYQALDDREGLSHYLLKGAAIPKSSSGYDLWISTLISELGQDVAIGHVVDRVKVEGLSAPVANYLYGLIDSGSAGVSQSQDLLKDVLSRAKTRNIEYTCNGCGFDTKAMYWHCPNCGEWESFN